MTVAERQYLENWIAKAENDIKAAERMLEGSDPITDMACFHCQQAVEKFFKAFLVSHHRDFEKVHNLFTLQNMCAGIDADLGSMDLKNLNYFGVTVRYPEEFYIPSPEEAGEYLAIAKSVRDRILRKIKTD